MPTFKTIGDEKTKLGATLLSDKENEEIKTSLRPGLTDDEKKKELKEKKLEKRREKSSLNEARKYLASKEEALTDLQGMIIKEIEFYNLGLSEDVISGKIEEWISRFKNEYALDDKELDGINSFVGNYVERRKNAKVFMAKYEDIADNNKEKVVLLNELTKTNNLTEPDMQGTEVSLGICSVDISARKEVMKKIHSKGAIQVGEDDMAGFANNNKDNNVWFTVAMKYEYDDLTKKHETEHTLFEAMVNKDKIDEAKDLYERARDLYEKQGQSVKERYDSIRKGYFDAIRNYALDRVKNEILASLRDGGVWELESVESGKKVWEKMFLDENEKNSYYFVRGECGREEVRKIIYDFSEDEWNREFLSEYRGYIDSAIKSMGYLIKVGKFSTDEAINFLKYKDIKYWPARVMGVLKGKMGTKAAIAKIKEIN